MAKTKMVALKEWDWNAEKYIYPEYPVEIVVDFVNKLREGKQWRHSPDPGRSVFDIFQRMQSQLMDYRAEHPAEPSVEKATEPSAETKLKGKGWRKRAREALGG